METNIKGLLLAEVNRMKEMMGLKILNEQSGFADLGTKTYDYITKEVFDVSDDAAEKLAKNTESTLKQFVGGSGSYDDILSYVAKSTGNEIKSTANVVDWIKSQPKLLDQLVKSSDDILKQAGQKVFANLKISNILDKPSIDVVNDLLTVTINKARAKSIIGEIDDALVTLRNVIKTKGLNKNVEDLIKQLEDRKKLAQSFETAKPKVDVGSVAGKTVSEIDSIAKKAIDEFSDDPNFKAKLEGTYAKLTDDQKIKIQKIVDNTTENEFKQVFDKLKNACGVVKESTGNKHKRDLLKEAKFNFDDACRVIPKAAKATTITTIWIIILIVVLIVGISVVKYTDKVMDFFDSLFGVEGKETVTGTDTESSGGEESGEEEQVKW